jgi:transcriptional regulator with XRE-family HTH domain
MAITLKAARVNAGMTQATAAKEIGVTADVISNWERGLSFPNVKNIMAIEKAYGIPYADIIFLPKDNVKTV